MILKARNFPKMSKRNWTPVTPTCFSCSFPVQRWYDYSAFGVPIQGTRLLPIKLPIPRVSQSTMWFICIFDRMDWNPNVLFLLRRKNQVILCQRWGKSTIGNLYDLYFLIYFNFSFAPHHLKFFWSRFSLDNLIDYIRSHNKHLACVIDLTYTRYYDPRVRAASQCALK